MATIGDYIIVKISGQIGRIVNVLDSIKLGLATTTMTVYVIEFDERDHLILPAYAFELLSTTTLPEELFEI